ncbi:putative inner membrane domain protein, partial [Chlamydia psittaci 84-8471/1]
MGSVEKLSLPQEDKMLVLEMLNSGNIIGALVFVHGRNNPDIQSIMQILDVNAHGRAMP